MRLEAVAHWPEMQAGLPWLRLVERTANGEGDHSGADSFTCTIQSFEHLKDATCA